MKIQWNIHIGFSLENKIMNAFFIRINLIRLKFVTLNTLMPLVNKMTKHFSCPTKLLLRYIPNYERPCKAVCVIISFHISSGW